MRGDNVAPVTSHLSETIDLHKSKLYDKGP